uniref:Putative secreted protein n=1 Tax=Anopheles triannulatus TaxID=58253 RepID=A0A2M4B5P4_9DIPT
MLVLALLAFSVRNPLRAIVGAISASHVTSLHPSPGAIVPLKPSDRTLESHRLPRPLAIPSEESSGDDGDGLTRGLALDARLSFRRDHSRPSRGLPPLTP